MSVMRGEKEKNRFLFCSLAEHLGYSYKKIAMYLKVKLPHVLLENVDDRKTLVLCVWRALYFTAK